MNKIYRVVYNQSTQTLQAVSELATGKNKVSSSGENTANNILNTGCVLKLSLLAISLSLAYVSPADAAYVFTEGTYSLSASNDAGEPAYILQGSNIVTNGAANSVGVTVYGTNINTPVAPKSVLIGNSLISQGSNKVQVGNDISITGGGGAFVTAIGSNITSDSGQVSITDNALGYISNEGGSIAIGANLTARANAVIIGLDSISTGTLGTVVGINAKASNDRAVAVGYGTNVPGLNATAVGPLAHASGHMNTAIGFKANATSIQSAALGPNSTASGSSSTAVGFAAQALSRTSTALGGFSTANNTWAVAIGVLSDSSGENGLAIGTRANVSTAAKDSIAVGTSASTKSVDSISIGTNSTGHQSAIGTVLIGANTKINGTAFNTNGSARPTGDRLVGGSASETGDLPTTVIGYNATSNSNHGDTLIGAWAKSGNDKFYTKQHTALGARAYAYGDQTLAIGADSLAVGNASIALGGDDIDAAAAGIAKALDLDPQGATESKRDFLKRVTSQMSSFAGEADIVANTDISGRLNPSNLTPAQIAQGAAGYIATASLGDASVSIGTSSQSYGVASTAIGMNALSKGDNAVALGTITRASGKNSIAIGVGSNASGSQSIAVGVGNQVSGNNAGAFGDPNTVSGNNSYAVGNDNTIDTADSFVLGNNVTTTAANSVFLGSGSNYTAAATTAEITATSTPTGTTAGLNTVSGANINNVGYSGFAGSTAEGVVAVGTANNERRIQGVAAGLISAASIDAINGSQLYAVITESHWKVQANGNAVGDVNFGDKVNFTSADNSVTITPSEEKDGVSVLDFKVNVDNDTISIVDGKLTAKASVDTNTHTGVKAATGGAVAVTALEQADAGDERTYEVDLTTDTKQKIDNALTSFTTSVNGNNVETIDKDNNDVNFVNGTGTIARVTDDKHITFDVNTTTITVDNNTGAVTVPATETNQIATAKTVADAISKAGFIVKANAETDGELINPGDSVTFKQGENIEIARTGSEFTIRTANDVTFTNVTASNVTTGDTSITNDGLTVGDVAVTNTPITVNGTTVNNVNEAITKTAEQAFNPLTFVGDDGNNVERKLGTTLNIKGGVTDSTKLSGGNIGVMANGNDTLDIKLAKDLTDIDSVTINNGPTINGDGINMNGDKITNVANGTNAADAVNVQQLNAAKSKVEAGKNVTIDTKTDDNGTVYTVNAKDSTVSVQGESAKYLTATAQPDADTHTTNYELALTEEAVKAFTDDQNTHTGVKAVENGAVVVTKQDTADEGDERTYVIDLSEQTKKDIAKEESVSEGDNVTVTANGTNTSGGKDFKVSLKNNIDLTDSGSVTIGDTTLNQSGLTINNGPSVTNTGINAGDKAITNVANGTNATDAVNVQQLNAAKTKVKAGTNVKDVVETKGDNGQPVYTINANGTTATHADSSKEFLTVSEAQEKADNISNYEVSLTQRATDALEKAEFALQSFTTSVNGNNVETLNKDNNDVNFVNGIGTTAENKNGDITFNVNKGGLTTDDNGNVSSMVAGDQFVTGDEIAKAINDSGFIVTASGNTAGTVESKLITTGDTVTFDAGKNLTVTQTGGKFSFATKDDVSFNSVTTNIVKLGDTGPQITNDGNNIKMSQADGSSTKITNVAPADLSDTSTDVVNGSQLYATNQNVANLTNKVNEGFNITADKKDPSITDKDNVKLGETVAYISESGNIITTVKDNEIDFDLADEIIVGQEGKDGEPGKDGRIGINGANGKDGVVITPNAIEFKGIDGVNGKDGIDGSASIKVEKGEKGIDGNDGIDGESKTRIVYEKPNGETETVATLNDGLYFKGNNIGTQNAHKLNSVVNIVGEGVSATVSDLFKSAAGNINVVANGNDKLEIRLNRDLQDLNSANFVNYSTNEQGDTIIDNAASKTTVGNVGITITPTAGDQVSVTDKGLDNGNNQIKNVAEGTDSTDAVNVNQLTKAINTAVSASQEDVVSTDGSLSVQREVNPVTQATTFDVSVNVDNTTITKDNDGQLTANTVNLTNDEDGKVNSPTIGGQDVGKSLVTAQTVVDAINNSGWNLAADGTNGKELVNAGDTVTFKVGSDNLTVKRDGAHITYDLAKDINVDSVKAGNTTVNNDGITIKNDDPNKTVSLTGNGLNNGGNQVKNVADGTDGTDAVNVNQLTKAINTAVSASQEDVVSTDGSLSVQREVNPVTQATTFDISVNVDNTTITKDNDGRLTANTVSLTNDATGKVNNPIVGGQDIGKSLVTAQTVTDAINNSGFIATASGNTVGATKDQLIKTGETVTLDAGKNLTVTQTDGKFSFATQEDVNFNSVQFGDITTGPKMTNDESNIKVSDNNGKAIKITNVADGDISPVSSDVINGSQLNNYAKVNGSNVNVTDGSINIVDGGGTTVTTNNAGEIKVNVNSTDLTVSDNGTIQLQELSENSTHFVNASTVANAVNQVSWSMNSTTDNTTANEATKNTYVAENNRVKVGDTVSVNSGRNVEISGSGRSLNIAVSDNPEFNSVTVGKGENATTISSNGDGLSIVRADGSPQRITNVAAGRLDNDAVNVSQLKGAVNHLDNKINRNNRVLRAGIAGANAAAGLPQVFIPGKSMVAASAGTYKGESALAVGYSRSSDNGKLILKLQGNTNTRGEVGGSVGVGYQW